MVRYINYYENNFDWNYELFGKIEHKHGQQNLAKIKNIFGPSKSIVLCA